MTRIRMALLLSFGLAVQAKAPKSAAALFDSARIWNIHLKFEAAQWSAMEPTGGQQAGFPGGPGGPRGFGPAMMIAPAFQKADLDGDGKISREEFTTLGKTWFTTWDKAQKGKLTDADLRAGVGSLVGPMPPPVIIGGPGGPRGMLGPEGGRNGASAMAGIEFPYAHAELDFDGTSLKDVAVRYKGNSTFMMSRNSLKRSMKIDLNKYTKGQKFAGVTTLNLHSNVMDSSWMKEPLSYALFRDGKVPAPRVAYARVYVTVPGKHDKQYLGLYSLVEDIDTEFTQERYGKAAGAIFKPSTRSLFSDLGDDWKKYKQTYDPKTDLTDAQKQRVIAMSRLVSSASDEDFAAKINEFLDVEEFARYLAINVWLANMDSILAMGQNFYLHLDSKSQKFQILPWDLDLSFGGMGGGTELSIQKPWQGQNKFLERLFALPAFKAAYLQRMKEFNQTIFQPERIAKLVETTGALIREAVQQESKEKLERFEKALRGEAEARPPGRMGPMGPGGPGGPPVSVFARDRAKSVAAQLTGESKGQEGGGMFGGPRGPGGPGGSGGFNPAMMIVPGFLKALDTNQDREVSQEEFQSGFARWFEAWGGKEGSLTAEQLRAGINRDLAPPMPGPGMMPF
jgi:spore coat protein H